MPSTLTISPLAATIEVGGTVQLSTVPAGGIKWSCTNCGVIKITNKGLVTGLMEGVSVITARRGNLTASSTITVIAATPVPPPKIRPRAVLTLSADGQFVNQIFAMSTVGTTDPDGVIIQGSLNWGDGTIQNFAGLPATIYTHTYVLAGDYTVTLTVLDNDGLTGTASVSLVVHPVPPPVLIPPNAVISYVSGSLINVPYVVSTAGTTDPDGTLASGSINWGDGSGDTTWVGVPPATASHTYTVAGTYVQTLTVVDNDALSGVATRQAVLVAAPANLPPLPVLAYVSGVFVTDSFVVSTQGTSDPDGTIAAGTLNWGDGVIETLTTPPFPTYGHVYALAGTYTVTLTVTDDDAATVNTSIQIVVQPTPPDPPPTNLAPVAVLTYLSGQFVGLPYTFGTAGSIDSDGTLVAGSISWGDGSLGQNWTGVPPASLSHVYSTAGQYTVVLSVTDNGGLTATASRIATLANQPPPPVNIPPVAALALITGASVNVPLQVSTGGTNDPDGFIASGSLAWGDGSAVTFTGPPALTYTHTYATAGSKTATLTVTDNQGAITATVLTITVQSTAPSGELASEGFVPRPNKTSVQSGDWHTGSTWSNGTVPTSADWVQINHAVTFDGTTRTANFWTLNISATGSLNGNYTGTNNVLTIISADRQPIDTPFFDTGIIIQGNLTLRGRVRKSWTRSTAAIPASANSFSVLDASGWQIGDRILVPDTREIQEPGQLRTDEVLVIQSISGTGPYTVTFTTSTTIPHPAAVNYLNVAEYFPPIGNLTRNIVIKSANPSGYRGHLLAGDDSTMLLTYIAVQDYGRTINETPLDPITNKAGRYPIHLHHMAVDGGATITGCVIERSKKWALTVHDTNDHLLNLNVVYDGQGWGIGTEGPDDSNTFEDNLVVNIWGVGDRGDGSPWGRNGSCYWFQGARNVCRRNVAVGALVDGWAIWVLPVEASSTNGNVNAFQTQALNTFEDNEALACQVGLSPWYVGRVDVDSFITRFIAWHNRTGIFMYPSSRVFINDLVTRGASTGANTIGLLFGDYQPAQGGVNRANIQGHKIGVFPAVGVAAPTPTLPVWPQKFIDCVFRNNLYQFYNTIQAGSYSSSIQPNVEWWLINPIFSNAQPGGYNVYTDYSVSENVNLRTKRTVKVYRYNGVTTDNFQTFHPDQAASTICPGTVGTQLGCPVNGLTNQQCRDQQGISLLGEIIPAGSFPKAGIYGNVVAIPGI